MKRTEIENINMSDYGFKAAEWEAEMQEVQRRELAGTIVARITATHKERYELVCEYGVQYGILKSGVYFHEAAQEAFPTTGDYVLIWHNPFGDCLIAKTLRRRTFFSRLDPSSQGQYSQVVAANFDYVFIMSSLNHDLNIARMERYLTLAWQSGAQPVIVLTKADLVGSWHEQTERVSQAAPGVPVYAVSALTAEGLEDLQPYQEPGSTIALLGSSGVGKSSLVNALAGVDWMKVNDIREDDSRGRHTTTHRQLIRLPGGAMMIDTPGMRSLGMWDVTEGLGSTFEDVEALFATCRFADCRHQAEPGCAVRAALEAGTLSQKRWSSYQKLKKEAKYSDDKGAYHREHQKWAKSLERSFRQRKKYDRKQQRN